MTYQRFQLPKTRPGPATVATIATEPPPEGQTVADVATVADMESTLAEFEERAGIVENEAGVPRAWAEGFARLNVAIPLSGFEHLRWRQLIDDGGRFLDRWALAASRFGWSATDVFGLSKSAPAGQYDGMGLVALIGGGEVIAVGEASATIRRPGGACLTYYLRRPRPDAVPAWDLVGDA